MFMHCFENNLTMSIDDLLQFDARPAQNAET